MLINILNDKKIKILVSILWGLGIALLFSRSCKGRSCIVIKGPRPDDMHNKIYSFDNKCYKYTAETTSCKVLPNADNIQTINTRS